MRTLLSILFLATLLLSSCSDGASSSLPADWPVPGMQLPAGAEVTEPIPALKMAQAFMTIGDGAETDYSETVAFIHDAPFGTVADEMEQALAAAGYWSIPGKMGQAVQIRGYIAETDDAFVTIMYTPLKDMFAVQAATTTAPSEKLKERREKEGTKL